MFGLGLDIRTRGSMLNKRIPFVENALFWLDGTVVSNEFIDKSGNGRNFTITNKDFTTNYFPYKSKATISAPVGDTELIAADVNNFLYDSGGSPNEIPVTALFQNIDYADKLFCRHGNQGLNGSLVETIEPRVLEIVLYTSALTGDDLTTADTYYSVPVEDLTAKWCATDGNDTTGDGSKANPYLTLTKANTESSSKVYIKSGEHDFGGAFIIPKNIEGTGFVTFTNLPAGYAFLTTTGSVKRVDLYKAGGNYPIYSDGVNNQVFEFVRVTGYRQASYAAAGVGTTTFKNSVFLLVSGGSYSFQNLKKGLVLDTCYVESNSSIYMIDSNSSANASQIDVKYSTINDITNGDTVYSRFASDYINLFNNYFIQSNRIRAAVSCSNFSFTYNTGTNKYIQIPNTTNETVTVENNVIEKSDANAFLRVGESNLSFKNNIITTSASDTGGFFTSTPTIAVSYYFENNRLESNGLSTQFGIGVGAVGGSDKITGHYKNNVMIQNNTSGSVNVHGIQVYNQKDFDIIYNQSINVGLSFIYKGDSHDYTGAQCSYNLTQNGSMVFKGAENLQVYGNTVVNEASFTPSPFAILINVTGTGNDNIFKNNILVCDGVPAIDIEDSGMTMTLDYNLIFTNQSVIGRVVAATYDFAGWQGLGFEANGINQDPDLSGLIPNSTSPAIGNGDNLGALFEDGLDTSTNWGNESTVPVIVNKKQNSNWDIGALLID